MKTTVLVFKKYTVKWKWLSSNQQPILYSTVKEVVKVREDDMVGWYHRFDGHEFEQAPGVGDDQGGLVCYSLWGCSVGHDLDWAELNWKEVVITHLLL